MNRFANMLKSLARGIGALSPGCRQAIRLQSEALDHKLPVLQGVGLRIHLCLCKWCRRYGKHIRFLRIAAHEHPDQLVDPVRPMLPDIVRERMKRRLRAEEAQRRL